jgi:hypothetical protein
MHGFLSNLLAVVVAAHAMWGCCRQHEHGRGHTHGPVTLLGKSPCSDAAHGCSASHAHRCCDNGAGTKCNAPPRTVRKRVESFPSYSQHVASLVPVVKRRFVPDEHLCTSGILVMSVRLHLLNQVLLI